MLLRATGANRTRIRWSEIKEIAFPYPDEETVGRFVKHIEKAEAARERALQEEDAATKELNEAMSLDGESAHEILDAFRPPN